MAIKYSLQQEPLRRYCCKEFSVFIILFKKSQSCFTPIL